MSNVDRRAALLMGLVFLSGVVVGFLAYRLYLRISSARYLEMLSREIIA